MFKSIMRILLPVNGVLYMYMVLDQKSNVVAKGNDLSTMHVLASDYSRNMTPYRVVTPGHEVVNVMRDPAGVVLGYERVSTPVLLGRYIGGYKS